MRQSRPHLVASRRDWLLSLLSLPFLVTPTMTPPPFDHPAAPRERAGAIAKWRLHLTRRFGTLAFRIGRRRRAWGIDARTGCVLTLTDDVVASWHPRTGQVMRAQPLPPLDYSDEGVLSPDGTFCAVLPRKGNAVLVYPLGSPAAPPRPRRFRPRWHAVHAAFFADNSLLFLGSPDGPLAAFDVATGREIATLQDANEDGLTCVAACGTAGLVALARRDGNVYLLDQRGRQPHEFLGWHEHPVNKMACSADGKRLIASVWPWSNPWGGVTVIVWDLARRRRAAEHRAAEPCVAFSAEGDCYAFCGPDGVEVWSLPDQRRRCLIPCRPEKMLISSDKFLYTYSGASIRCWNSLTGREVTHPAGHLDSVVGIFPPADGVLSSWGRDDRLCSWDVATARLLESIALPDDCIAVAPASGVVAVGTATGSVLLVDPQTGRSREVARSLGRVDALFSRGQEQVVAVTEGERLCVVDARRKIVLRSVRAPNRVRCCHLSQSGSRLVTNHDGGAVRIWSVPELSLKHTLRLDCYSQEISSFTAQSEKGVIVGFELNDSSRLILLDLERGAVICTRLVPGLVASGVCCSPDGKVLAVGTMSGDLACYSLPSFGFLDSCRGHEGCVRTVAFSPDGRHIFSGANDSTIACWSLEPGRADPPR